MTEGVALHQLVYEGGEAVDYIIADVNPAFERHTTMSAGSVQGRRASEAYGTGEAPYLAEYAKVVESAEPCTFETYFEPLLRHFRITAVALEGARFATVFDDITERKRAAETLRESEERFRLLHDTMLQGVVYQDADGTIISMNPAAERILGKRPEDFLGSSSIGEEHDTLREDGTSFPGLEHPAMLALRTGQPVPDVLMQVYNLREAQYRLISVQAVPLFRPGEDSPYRVYTVFDDVTERRRAEEAQRELEAVRVAQAERSRVARDLHDSVTQALFAATMKAEALTLAGDSLSEGSSQLAEGVRRLSRGALAQMRTLLLELRGDALEDVPISQLLRQLVEAAESRASVNVQLTIRGDVQLSPTLHTPIYRIAQEALNNVTRHASASKAWVDLDVEPDRTRLVVGDDGCGFEPSACDPTHIGLNSMRERAAEAGAQFDLVTKPGGGTLITVGWPRD
jgi:PAS domain S-box-containing protein